MVTKNFTGFFSASVNEISKGVLLLFLLMGTTVESNAGQMDKVAFACQEKFKKSAS